MPECPKPFEEMLPTALESFRDQFRDLSEGWRHLDTKAQGAGAISGVFLAAAFSWAKEIPDSFGPIQRFILVVCVALLIVAVICSVIALQIRTIQAPPFGSTTANMIRGMIRQQHPLEIKTMSVAFYNDQMKIWESCNRAMEVHLGKKSRWIRAAHWLLLSSALLVASDVIWNLMLS